MKLKHYEVQEVALCWDNKLHTSKTTIVAESVAEAKKFVDRWNDAGRERYVYSLTGIATELTREENKNVRTYEGSNRLYVEKPNAYLTSPNLP